VVSNPKRYYTIPLKRALNILYQQKNQQVHELKKLTTHVLLDYDKKVKTNQNKVESKFVLVPQNKQLINRIAKAISDSKTIVRIMTSWNRHLKAADIYRASLKKALSNGVKFQVLVTKNSEDNELSKKNKDFLDHPNIMVRFINSPSKIVEVIIDDQEVFVMTDPKADIAESSALWTNNKSLIIALTTCFNTFYDLPEVY